MNTHYELLAKATLRSNCHQIITKKNKQNNKRERNINFVLTLELTHEK